MFDTGGTRYTVHMQSDRTEKTDQLERTIYFNGGTLVLNGIGREAKLPGAFRWEKNHWRCEGYHYAALVPWLREEGIRDTVPRWTHPALKLNETRQPHDYQTAALRAWEAETVNRRGSIILPTGAGKTFVAIQAIYRAASSALVVAPTVDLLHQWYMRLTHAFGTEIGVYYGGEKIILPLTVTTYHSAGDIIAAQGNAFKLIIFDEVHHLPAPAWGEAALMCPAPFRLGLTATYPDREEQSGERWSLDDLIGPVVFVQRIDDLVGQQLAEYRTERMRIDLTPAERTRYDADYAIYSQFFRSRALNRTHGANWLQELNRLSAFDPEARRAQLARQRILRLLAAASGKFEALDQLLHEYEDTHTLIFAENNDVVYRIARRHLIPAITASTKAAERKAILDGFRTGLYRTVVTCEVLNEGVDVPEAKIAIVLGGMSGARAYIQRLGRVLRKVESQQALLVEVIARKTVEDSKAARRKRKGT